MDRDALSRRYRDVRRRTESLAEPLAAEDQVVQSMPDVSPTKWHLAHTSWFFETFVLEQRPGYVPFDPRYRALFNSYYWGLGAQYPRDRRGLLSRPTVDEIRAYRAHVDAAMREVHEPSAMIELGIHHEEQHQELILTDLKHMLGQSPLSPSYGAALAPPGRERARPAKWISHEGGLVEVGHDAAGFAFDNEGPRHRVYLQPFALADRAVTCGEWMEFVADRGYERAELWLADGYGLSRAERWSGPLYWDEGQVFTLAGLRAIDPAEPVAHVSFYEADAYARWAGARLPTEHEWEVVASRARVEGNLLEAARLHPAPAATGATQLFGDVWEWTASPYVGYPGYVPPAGAIGEYNGKFMSSQMVLRGGSCFTPAAHMRATYRNFFPPAARWQMTGLRLARDENTR
jgi:ergothioneine biosynthesis protein EgtB